MAADKIVAAALVCMEERPKKGADEWARMRLARINALNAAQVLGLALAMRDGGSFEPLLVLEKDSPLAEKVHAYSLPCIYAGTFLRFHLWRWQRKKTALLVQTVGAASVRAGYRLYGLRKKGTAVLAHAFFLKEPNGTVLKSRAMLAASHVLCGSYLVETRIADILGDSGPRRVPDQPGLSLENWTPAPGFQGKGHFVFGMGQSLLARSGALMVVRAMGALWQRDDLPPWEVRMFGSGPRFEEILAEAENLGVASRLCLLADQDLPEALLGCHAWLAPGSNPRELPETAWAGVAAGLPTVCVQSPLHKERLPVGERACALRVQANDPQGLARAMISLMRDERLRLRLAGGAASLRPEIGIAAMAGRTCRLYGEMARELGG